MKMKKWLALCLAVCMMLVLCACGDDGTGVYVQSVADLMNMGAIAPGDRFAGILVSENVAEVQKDEDKTIEELLVKEGDDVKEGQVLFSYDTDQLQMNLDKRRLELEQLLATIENYKDQISELEKERAKAASGDKLEYTVQIQTLQVDLKESELSVSSKKTEIAQSEAILENATVVSPVTGRVQSINENGMDNYGNPLPYITIQQAGSYRVKGTIGELQLGGIMEGTQMKIVSRTDESQTWTGIVSLVDYENPTQGNEYDMYYGGSSDEMTSASKYPFYVELNDTEGLILGQHVYMELDTGEETAAGVSISSAFICFEEDGTAYVWAENWDKLAKRTVTLGEYNMAMDTYEILDGLYEYDYIAFPDPELCKEGVPTTHENTAQEEPVVEGEVA